MERLTNKREADAQREEYERRLANGYPRNIPEERFLRLAAYEDTGLSPQACAEAREAGKVLSSCDISFRRLAELLSADRAGRLAVLPCKVGDTVYVINRHLGQIFANTVISISVGNSTDLKNYIKTKWVGEKGNESIRKWTLRQVGRYVFLTHEEAEKALEAMRDGN